MIYAAAVGPFGPEHQDERDNLDNVLGVSQWKIPGAAVRRRIRSSEPIPEGAPSWWHGNEEASDSFLREMEVELE